MASVTVRHARRVIPSRTGTGYIFNVDKTRNTARADTADPADTLRVCTSALQSSVGPSPTPRPPHLPSTVT